MLRTIIVVIAMLFGAAARAADYTPSFDPSKLKGPEVGPPNQVLVLGTAHLRGLPADFDPKFLGQLLDRLQAWKPQIITIEAISGTQCDSMRRYPKQYEDVVKGYCRDTTAARDATGLDVPAASVEVDRLLADLSATPTAAQRRHLAAIFLAADEPISALVQWLRLPANEQIDDQYLHPSLVAILKGLALKRSEDALIAAPLAVRLGLERVFAIDHHPGSSSDAYESDQKAYWETVQRLWDNPATAARSTQDKTLFAHLNSDEGVLALYRALNQPDQAQLVYESDFGAAMKDPSPQFYGRNYVGYWETRNLRMVSNIRQVLEDTPGKRLLSIVGASHKGYFEAYLNMMHDVHLVDVEQVLSGPPAAQN